MKKKKIFMLFFMTLFLVGCTNGNIGIKVKKNKEVDLKIVVNIPQKEKYKFKNIKDDLENNGYIFNCKSDLCEITKHFENIDYISNGNNKDKFDLLYFYTDKYDNKYEEKFLMVEKDFTTNKYTGNLIIDTTTLDLSNIKSNITFKLTVPNGTVSNNANNISEDGNKLTWNINKNGLTEINFSFELDSYDYIFYGIAILIVIFLIFSIISVLFYKEDVKGDVAKRDEDTNKKINSLMDRERQQQITKRENIPVQIENDYKEKSKPIIIPTETVNHSVSRRENVVNNLVPEIDMFKEPSKPKKAKSKLFNIFKKKNKEESSANTIDKLDLEDDFTKIVNNINSGNNTLNLNNETINIKTNNSHEELEEAENNIYNNMDLNNDKTIDINNNTSSLLNNILPTNNNVANNNITKSNDNIQELNNNLSMNNNQQYQNNNIINSNNNILDHDNKDTGINNIPTSVNSFLYDETLDKNIVEEESDEELSTIKLNSHDIKVDNIKK